MDKSFKELPRLVQFILLLIPIVNWVTEIVVRVSYLLREKNAEAVLGLILVLFFGLIIGWIDLVWVLLFNKLILT